MSNYMIMRVVTHGSLEGTSGVAKMGNVVEKARSLFGRMSRHRPVKTGWSPNQRRCDNLTNSADLVGRVEGLEPYSNNGGSDSTLEATVGIGARFGKYYLQKIANLDNDIAHANMKEGRQSERSIYLLQR